MAILSAHEDDSAHLEGERRKADFPESLVWIDNFPNSFFRDVFFTGQARDRVLLLEYISLGSTSYSLACKILSLALAWV